ncbi:sodium/hydrogen exchanger 2-like [Watersipora subatra]|uniref:sodium/hydrogen exchanger 2-like n=1 Tax=Watersipora subatra TaxID=2589382 RepID=UPI00355C91C0
MASVSLFVYSAASDSFIFLYLGVNLVRVNHQFHIGFIGATIFLCLITRFVVTYILSAILNRNRVRKISKREQLIMAYGGLRGAVAFSLVSLLKLDQETMDLLMTTMLMLVIFTVFIQGGTIKPLVSLLEIKTKETEQNLSLLNELTVNAADHVMAGVEQIVGDHGVFVFYNWVIQLDDKHIKHLLQRNPMRKDEKIMKLYEKIALKQHFAALQGVEIAETFEGGPLSPLEGSVIAGDTLSVCTDTARNGWKPTTPSLLGQLTRYGDIEEPEHVDDIAYITPEMLEDEELTTAEQRRLSHEQHVIDDNLIDGQHLGMLLTKPGSIRDTRKLRSGIDMDDRSNFMFLLQEKSKRLERLKRSRAGSLSIPESGSISQAPISEVADVGGCTSFFRKCPCVQSKAEESGQIVRKGGRPRQGSIATLRLQSRVTSRRGTRTEADSPLPTRIVYSPRNRTKVDQSDAVARNHPKRYSADSDFYSGAEELESKGSREDIELGRAAPSAPSSIELTSPLSTVVELPERGSEVSLAKKAAASKQIEPTEADNSSEEIESDECQTRL